MADFWTVSGLVIGAQSQHRCQLATPRTEVGVLGVPERPLACHHRRSHDSATRLVTPDACCYPTQFTTTVCLAFLSLTYEVYNRRPHLLPALPSPPYLSRNRRRANAFSHLPVQSPPTAPTAWRFLSPAAKARCFNQGTILGR